jgi:hypothetical protein
MFHLSHPRGSLIRVGIVESVFRGLGFDLLQGQKIFIYSAESRPGLGPTQPSIQLVPRALSPGLKWQWCEAGHPPTTSVGVKNSGAIPPLPYRSSWLRA